MAGGSRTISPQDEEGVWQVLDGDAELGVAEETYRDDGTEKLTYNNPYGLELERVWFDGKLVYAISGDQVDVDPAKVKVAQEYQIVYAVDLDEDGRPQAGHEPERVEGQYNIYDSVPGMDGYSPLWQFNYVVVPRDYEPNSLRSQGDCVDSGYPIEQSSRVEN